ncbi:amino acid adenylation domain-containing protein [Pseudonocardia phyllosphaerae]|uniref:amino acid adenylation domain-containing protein n=1 Tax=Pseudonocardia phyllosphaerae TaxID=3390502 RepID=UPI0039782C7C
MPAEGFPLTDAQTEIVLAARLRPDDHGFHIGARTDLDGPLDPARFADAADRVLAAAGTLHVRIVDGPDGTPRQVPVPPSGYELQVVDVADAPDPDRAADAEIDAALSAAYDLAVGPLAGQRLIRRGSDRWTWLLHGHHAVLDGVSFRVLVDAVARAYAGEPPATPQWSPADLLTGDGAPDADAGYWRDALAGAPDAARLAPGSGTAARRRRTLTWTDGEWTALAGELGTSAPRLLVAALAAYLRRVAGPDDVLAGLATSGRHRGEPAVPGMLSGVLPLRVAVPRTAGLADLVAPVADAVSGIARHGRTRAVDLLRERGVRTAPAEAFGTGINVLSWPSASFGGTSGRTRLVHPGPGGGLDLLVELYPDDATVTVALLALPGAVTDAELDAHAARLRRFLDACLADPRAPLGRVDLLDPAEHASLARFGDGGPVGRAPATFGELFDEQVRRRPDAVALVDGDTALTYAELAGRAGALARTLATHGAGPGETVAVALGRSAELVVGLVGAMLSGAAYLALDVDAPAERTDAMLADAGPVAVVGERDGEIPVGDAIGEPVGAGPAGVHDPAYVIYTSGSTGRPKGVVVTHEGTAKLVATAIRRMAVGPDSVVLQFASPAFDVAFFELCQGLLCGGRLVVTPSALRVPDAPLIDHLHAHGVTHAVLPPSLLAVLPDGVELPDGLTFLAGTERVSPELVARHAPGRTMFNAYGPTETTVNATLGACRAGAGAVPIGRPDPGVTATVRDAALAPVPVGVPGELYLGGHGVARGYLNRSGLTAERFVADPSTPGATMYRTGDLVAWTPDGELDFLGRADDQVKVRGHRIEPGEVEAALLAHPSVDRAVVARREDTPGDVLLAAYVVGSDPDNDPDPITLRASVADVLPAHMVPAAVVVLPEIPLMLNGKIDRAALPAPGAADRPAGHGRPPRTPAEELLCGLAAEVLGVPVGPDDDLLAAGAHSLSLMRLVTRARAVLGGELTLPEIMAAPTVAAVAARSAGSGSSVRSFAPRRGQSPQEPALSPAQLRMWAQTELGATTADRAYLVPMAWRVRGPLDVDALRRALADLAGRHEVLRTVLPAPDGVPHQRIRDEIAVPLDVEDVPSDGVAARLAELSGTGFALDVEVPVRATVLRVGPDEHVLLLVFHHVAVDEWSVRILCDDLTAAYAARVAGAAPDLPEPAVRYVDAADWQATELGAPDDDASRAHAQLAHWRAVLDGAPGESGLPATRERPAEPSGAGGVAAFTVPADVADGLARLARGRGATLFSAAHAALAALLARLGSDPDVVVGAPVSVRPVEQLAGVVGCFLNTVALRVDTGDDPAFAVLLDRARDADLAAVAHQDVPFERVVDALAPDRVPGRHPLFQTALVVSHGDECSGFALAGARTAPEPLPWTTAKFDLTVHLRTAERSGALHGLVEYAADLFDEPDAMAIGRRLAAVLTQVVADPSVHVGALDVLDDDERSRALAAPSPVPLGKIRTLAGRVRAMASEHPDATAVVAGQERLTHAELDRSSAELAARLAERGAGPGTLVAVALRRTARLAQALLAVTRTGAGYLPLDPAHPADRISYVLDDAKPVLLLTESGVDLAGPADLPVLLVDDPASDPAPSAPARSGEPDPEDVAYVIYTSGSTGRPKGVPVPFRAVLGLLDAAARCFELDHTDAWTLFHSAAFDFSVWELWGPLTTGGRVVVVDTETVRSPEAFRALLAAERITVLSQTPSAFARIADTGPDGLALRYVVFGGEALDPRRLRRWFGPGAPRMVNMYGITETTVHVTVLELTEADTERGGSPVGDALPGLRIRLLDAALRPVPAGVVGEIHVCGTQLARGYLGRPGLTAGRFVPDPWGAPGTRMYRSGDLGRWRADGTLEFLGRGDDQVSLRGHRIEPGEVETALLAASGVERAAVVLREDEPGRPMLVGYVVGDADPSVLRDGLASRLPEYMVPAAVVGVPELPLTVNGKLDRRALPAPDFAAATSATAPRDAREEALCAVFADVLGLPGVGVDDDFFVLGGDSIVAIQLANRARRAGVPVCAREVFLRRTPAGLAAAAGPAPEPVGADVTADVTAVTSEEGDVAPLPIVTRFAGWGGPIDRFNQAMLVQTPAEATAERLTSVLQAVCDRHAALRLRLHRHADGVWSQEIGPSRPVDAAVRVDARGLDGDALRARIAAESDAAADRLDPDAGTTLAAVWFDAGDRPGRLLLVVHHLAVDGVSWRILFDDLAHAWSGDAPEPVGTSLRAFGRLVAEQAASGSRLAELDHWTDVLAPGAGLLDGPATPATVGQTRRVTVTLGVDETRPLLTTIPAAAGADVTDVLLAALAAAAGRMRGAPAELLVDLERHGRDELAPGVDLSRTLGWFTAIAPLRLPAATDAGPVVREIHDRAGAAPDGGAGYGMLRYGNVAAAAALERGAEPQLLVNYLGRVGVAHRGDWAPAPEGDAITARPDPAMGAPYPLEINAVTTDTADGPSLSATVTHTPDLSTHDADAFAEAFAHALRELAAAGPDAVPPRAADLDLVALDDDGLARVVATAGMPVADVWPLSPLQEGLFFQAGLTAGAADVYTVQNLFDLDHRLDVDRLRAALGALLDGHPTLRAGFTDDGLDAPVQFVARPGHERVAAAVTELPTPADGADAETARQRTVPFDLADPPALRLTVLRDAGGPGRDRLLLHYHLLLCDGWSRELIINRLFALYAGEDVPSDGDGFRRYLRWFADRNRDAAVDAWRGAFAGFTEPTIVAHGPVTPDGALPRQLRRDTDAERTAALHAVARRAGVPLNSLLTGALGLALAGVAGRTDVAFGTTVAGRPDEVEGLDTVIGLFLNTVPVRVTLDPQEGAHALAARLRDEWVALMEHDFLDLGTIQRATGHPQLFDTLFVLQNFVAEDTFTAFERRHGIVASHAVDATQYPVVLLVHPGTRLNVRLEYRPDVVDETTAHALLDRFHRIVDALASGVDDAVATLARTAGAAGSADGGSGRTAEIGVETVADLLRSRSALVGDEVAVVCGDERVTYAELQSRVDGLARALHERGAGPERVVALGLPRSVDSVVALFAVLCTGAAYQPLELDHPTERLTELLDDTGPAVLVATREVADRLGTALTWVDPADHRHGDPLTSDELGVFAASNPHRLEHPAYVIHTSGSTGRPKGVVTPYRGLTNMQRNHRAEIFGPALAAAGGRRLRVAHTVSFAFDMSWEELLWLVEGGEVHVCDEELRRDAHALVRHCHTHAVDVVNVTPTYAAALFEEGLLDPDGHVPGLVMLGGEAVSTAVWDRLREYDGTVGYNLYGPTEYTINTLGGGTDDSVTPTVGRPVHNTRAVVLDPWLAPVDDGVPGELYIAGAGLARGYLDRPGLTAERFVADPGEPGGRMYRTGDLVRCRPGTWDDERGPILDYLGRTDDQVKIRGHRVEPGEVAAHLDGHPGVARSAVVAAAEPGTGAVRLVAYVVPAPATDDARAGVEAAQLGEWEEIYADEYRRIPTAVFAEDFSGWDSSATGEPIPLEQMREWRAETVRRIRELRPQRILEIGVGTGLLLGELAPDAEAYVGTDLAAPIVAKLRTELARDPRFLHVELSVRPAHDLPDGRFDTIVINSVVQYFPGADYLARVLHGALGLLEPGGRVVVGDVRHLGTLAAFHAENLAARSDPTPVERAVALEKELLLAPEFFAGLGVPVSVRTKRGRYRNELTAHRYDVVLHDPAADVVDVAGLPTVPWSGTLPDGPVRVVGVPDRRLGGDGPEQEDLFGAGGDPTGQEDPAAGQAPVAVTWGEPGQLEVVVGAGADPARWVGVYRPRDGVAQANDPGAARAGAELVATLRSDLGDALPSHLVPAAFVLVDDLPLTPNGKLDVAALPAADAPVVGGTRPPEGPVEEALCALFAEVLGVGEVGAGDDFFALGGHSLLATRIVSRARTALGAELAIRDLFEAPTVAELAERVGGAAGGTGPSRPALEPGPRPDRVPLSPAQQRLWLVDRLGGEAAVAYNYPFALRLHGTPDLDAVAAALADVADRHEILRTTVAEHDGVGYQHVRPRAGTLLEVEDCAPDAVRERVAALAAVPFDLAVDVPLRATLLRVAPDECVLVLVLHHIATDEWSDGPLFADLDAAYAARAAGRPPGWEPLPVQYADYTLWQGELLDAVADGQLDHWRSALAGLPTEIELPTDRDRPAVRDGRGARAVVPLPATVVEPLRALCAERGVSMSMLVHAATAALLHRLGAGEDIPLGVPVAGRSDDAMGASIGFFVNTLVLRSDLSGDPSFGELLSRTRATDLAAFDHADVPFEHVVEALAPPRAAGRNPLFQVMSGYHRRPGSERRELFGLPVGWLDDDVRHAKFDLHVTAVEQEDTGAVTLVLDHATDRTDPATGERLVRRLARLLEIVADDPDRPLGLVDLLADDERATLAAEHDTVHPVPDATLPEQFAEQVARTPDAPALVADDGALRLTYAELDARVDQAAALLDDRGVRPGDVVAVRLPRSAELVVALHAVHRVGAAYLPVGTDLPDERVEFMLGDARPACVLTVEDMAAAQSAADPGRADRPAPPPEASAYVLYTSGSTGKPKGVVVSHRAIANRIAWMQDTYRLTGADRVLQKTPASFDVSVWEFFWPLTCGAVLVVAAPDGHRDAEYLAGLIESEQVTLLHFVPSMLDAFVTALDGPGRCASLRQVVCSGEALGGPLSARALDVLGAPVDNLYGPTEAAVDVSRFAVVDPGIGDVPIGRPVWNTRLHVLDAHLAPVPPGVPGELYLAGVQLADGYLARPGLTASRFVADPAGGPGERLYRTGDRARRRVDGVVEFLGRTDDQVKLRGFRIELGEVAAALAACDGVERAVADLRGDRLVGYVVPGGGAGDVGDLRERLRATLPEHMVPATVVELDAMPVTVHGKLDRAALPDPATPAGGGGRSPRPGAEARLCAAVAEVLDLPVDAVGPDDDFFALGGHSLTAIRLVARLGAERDARVPLRAVFDAPTPAGLLALLDRSDGPEVSDRPAFVPVPRPEVVPLPASARRMWMHQQLRPQDPTYHIPLAFRLRGPLDVDALRAAVRDLVLRQDALRSVVGTDAAGEPVARLLEPDAVPVIERAVTEESLDAELTAAVREPFALDREPPLRVHVLRLGVDGADGAQEAVLLLVVHHVATDEWSTGPLLDDLTAAYAARRAGTDRDLPPLRAGYHDHALWQRDVLDRVGADQAAYWTHRLAGAPEELALPYDRARPAEPGHAGDEVDVMLDAALAGRLRAVAAARGVSVFMLVHAATAVLLGAVGGGTDVPVGTPVSGRADPALDRTVGFFLNTLVLRTDLSGNPTFGELLDRVRATDLEAFDHQDLPFEQVVSAVAPARAAARHPLFQVMVVHLPGAGEAPSFDGVDARPVRVHRGVATFDLSVNVGDTADGPDGSGMSVTLEYSRDLFDRATVEGLAARFERVLRAVADDADVRLSAVDVLDPGERARVLGEWNATEVEVPGDTLPGMVARRIAERPDAVAVTGPHGTLTYAGFGDLVERIAALLHAHGVGRGDVVALLVPRSPESVAAAVATTRLGAAFLALDPDLPADRLSYMLDDSGARLALVRGTATVAGCPVVDVGDAAHEHPPAPPMPPIGAADPAYVIYTSGSTGRPKGVVVPHDGIPSLVATAEHRMGVDRDSRVLHFASQGFDVTVFELSMALCSGARLVLPPDGARTAGRELTDLIADEGVTHAILPPALVAALPSGATLPEGLVVLVGTETVPPELIRRWAGHLRLFAAYGLTEATVNSTLWDARPDRPGPVPIGVPDPNTRVYVLDDFLRPLPPGAVGELYVAGRGLAAGYLGRPGLTAERFLANPFGPGRLYRTGDLARWAPDGVVVHLGRADDQVKIRGFRIELGEVESALRAQPGVAQAAVAVRRAGGTARLDGYVVGEPGLEPGTLREALAGTLPDYMVPATVTVLDADLPTGASGKVDRRLLPEPDVTTAGRPPATAAEQLVADLVADLLGLSSLGADDDLFALGADSLVVMRLVGGLRARGHALTPAAVTARPTVSALAAQLGEPDPELAAPVDPSAALGEAPPTPALADLVATPGAVDGFGSPVLVQTPAGTGHGEVTAALAAVVAAHPVLGARLDTGTGALHVPPPDGPPVRRVDARGWPDARLRAAVLFEAYELAAGLVPEAGRMLGAVWFDAGQGEPGRLLLVAHHAVVDGVSWRVLLDDLASAARGDTPAPEPLPYRGWARGLAATVPAHEPEAPYWRELLAAGCPVPGGDRPPGPGRPVTVRRTLPADLTAAVLRGPAGPDHVMLAALAHAVGSPLVVGLQAHGRDDVPDAGDASRTVGWLGGLTPVALNVTGLDPAGSARAVTEQVRAVPGGGVGYRVLRHLSSHLDDAPDPLVYVNYEGRFARPSATPWAAAPEADEVFAQWGDERPSPFRLSLIARTADRADGPRLLVWWTAGAGGPDADRVGAIADAWRAALEKIIRPLMEFD